MRHWLRRIGIASLSAALSSSAACGTDNGDAGAGTGGGAGGGAGAGGGVAVAKGAAIWGFGGGSGGELCAKPLVGRAGVGDVDGKAATRVTNGEMGSHVTCQVAPSGGGYTVNAHLTDGTTSFNISGTFTPGQDNTGQVQVYTPDVKATFTSPDSKPCTVNIDATAADQSLTIAAGKVWGSFTCPEVVPVDDPKSATCALTNSDKTKPGGYFSFEGCGQE